MRKKSISIKKPPEKSQEKPQKKQAEKTPSSTSVNRENLHQKSDTEGSSKSSESTPQRDAENPWKALLNQM